MYVSFDELPKDARVWIYQSDRKLTAAEVKEIENGAKEFLTDWKAHSNPLKSSIKVAHQQFIILGVDESFNKASGCSIDSSVDFVRQIEKHLNINLFNRTQIAFYLNNEVFMAPMNQLKEKVAEGAITPETITFNNLVDNVEKLEQEWMVPAKESWLSRYFAK